MPKFARQPGTVRLARLIALQILLLGVAALTLPVPAAAHEGHDHGPPPPPLPASVKPRVTAETDSYQLVAIAAGPQLTIFLDRYATNEPVVDASIGVLSGSETIAATPRADGSYLAKVPALEKPGRHELVFNVAHRSGDDLLAGFVEIAPAAAPGTATQPGRSLVARALPSALTLLAGLAIGIAFRTRRALAIAAAGALCVAMLATAAFAHEGHDQSPVPEGASLTGDVPRRLPDGSVFMPKPSQRLLTVRSQVAIEGEARRAVSLVGRIIADPNRSGVVQSINGGRVSPPEGRFLPRLGQSVSQGEALAIVQPALPLADQSNLAEKQRELEGAILLARQKHARLSRLGGNVTPRSSIEDTELEISNLTQRLASLRAAQLQPEVLAAPIAGVISTSRVVAGQVVGAQDVLFQIVDLDGLWVEALLFDQLDPGAIVEATAVTGRGTAMKLAYRGRGRALQGQAVQIQFAIEAPPADAALGLPVSVIARKAEPVRGMLLPRDAIVRGPAGEAIVWHHIEPERFVARQVRTEPFDGEQVLVTGGISPRDRIVVHAAELLSQVR